MPPETEFSLVGLVTLAFVLPGSCTCEPRYQKHQQQKNVSTIMLSSVVGQWLLLWKQMSPTSVVRLRLRLLAP